MCKQLSFGTYLLCLLAIYEVLDDESECYC